VHVDLIVAAVIALIVVCGLHFHRVIVVSVVNSFSNVCGEEFFAKM